jgi:nitrogen-specific signal transduction histidine kinase/HD-like signal output (HDOD) protein
MRRIAYNVHQVVDVTSLPTLPHILFKLIEKLRSNDVPLPEVAEMIGHDPALSARVINIANSAAFRSSNPVTSVERAVIMLGLETVRTITMTAAVQQFFSGLNQQQFRTLQKRMWHQSIISAVSARVIAELVNYQWPDEAYLMGLLTDIGQLALVCSHAQEYMPIIEQQRDTETLLSEEQQNFMLTHPDIASQMFQAWGFESLLIDAARYHHEPGDDIMDAHLLVKIINFATRLGENQCQPSDEITLDADRLFGFTGAFTTEIMDRTRNRVGDIADLFGIELEEKSAATSVAVQGADNAGPSPEQMMDIRLGREVRDHFLLSTVEKCMDAAQHAESHLHNIRESAMILFGVGQIFIFTYAEKKTVLVSHGSHEYSQHFSDIRIKPASSRSLIARSVADARVTDSFGDYRPGISDQQIMNLAGKEGMVCLPLSVRQNVFGTLVLLVDEAEYQHLQQRLHLLKYFAEQVSRILTSRLGTADDYEEPDEQATNEHDIRMRQLVHEASNPLGIMKNYLGVLSTKLNSENNAQEEIRILNEEIDRVKNLLDRFRDRNDNTVVTADNVDINSTIRDLVMLMEQSISGGISINLDLVEPSPNVKIDTNKLKQVVLNLLRNAVEALAEGGRITVSTHDHIKQEGREFIEIAVQDNGPGLPRQIFEHLFEPVTTTKGKGHSGLGLAIAQSLVDEMGGRISCRSEPGRGATFQVLLPGTARADIQI